MRVLVYGLNYAPELTGIGKYTGELAAFLAARGHEVRVVTAPPYYPAWQVARGYHAARYQRERLDGVAVLRCPLWVPRKPSGAKRLVHLASFAASSLVPAAWLALTWRPAVVFTVAPALASTPGAWLAARLGGAVAWLHIQDFEVDAAFGLGLLEGGGLKRLALGLERWLLARFDRLSTISGAMQRLAIAKGVGPERVVRFDNWVDTRHITPDPEAGRAMRAGLGIGSEAVVALYSGNMGAKQGLEVLVAAARLAADDPASRLAFVICGEGGMKAELEAAAAGLPNMRFLPLQPLDRLNGLLNMADVHLLPQRADAADLVMPSKLTGMLASGRAIVATALPGTGVYEVVVEAGGVVVPPEDAAALALALSRLASDAPAREMAGERARAYALSHLEAGAILTRFERDLEAAVAVKGGADVRH